MKKKKGNSLKLVLAISVVIFLSVLFTILILNDTTSKVEVGTTNDNVGTYDKTIENAYIVSSSNGMIEYLYNKELYQYKGILESEYTGVADIVFNNDKIVKILTKEAKIHGKILSFSDDNIEIENYGNYKRDKSIPIYKLNGKKVNELTWQSVIVGTSKYNYIMVDDTICALIQSEEMNIQDIRVLLKNGNKEFYDSLWIKGDSKLLVNEKKISKKLVDVGHLFEDKDEITVSVNQGKMYFGAGKGSISNNGYEGVFIIRKTKKGYVLVNEISVEDYVKYVLPSEMPVSFPFEALKAQAICARTFAYSQMKNLDYAKYGANLDDTTSYQVYNSSGNNEISDKAVRETAGKVVTCDKKLIVCYYFSTCSNKTEDMEVWGSDTPKYVCKKKSKDKNSPFYSWEASINFEKRMDPEYGRLKYFSVSEKSDCGFVLKLDAEFENGKRTYETENDIRNFLGGYMTKIVLADGSERTDMSKVPSACFEISARSDKVYRIKGGGYGHCIGFSQYGAANLAKKGKSCEDIIKYYYSNVEVENIIKAKY